MNAIPEKQYFDFRLITQFFEFNW